jgi:hypothetical protein
MTTVRKKAMDAFLRGDGKIGKTGKKARGSVDRSRLNSEDSASNRSRSSIGSHDAITELSTVPTAYTQSLGSTNRTETSSPTRSSIALSSYSRDAPGIDGAMVRRQRPHDFVLPAAPIVLPSRRNIKLPYDDYLPPPFVSIGKAIDPFQTMFQSSHPQISVEELKFHCSRYFGTRALGRYWIPTALRYAHTFLGTLCLATAYHDVIHEEPLESVQTIALRQEVIHLVGRNMLNADTRASDHNIMAVIQLIISEVIGREESGLNWHENGLENMVKERGGLNQLGIDGHLASSIAWVSLATAVLREEQPRSLYADYCAANSRKQYQPIATIPESPIYCPRATFHTIERSSKCTSAARELLGEIRMMIDMFLHETKQSRRNVPTLLSIHDRITNSRLYPPVSEFPNPTIADYRYEALRLASIIQATAIIRRIPLSDALAPAAETHKSSTLYAYSMASLSNESLVSPSDIYTNSAATEYATSPSYPTYSTSPAFQQGQFYFPSSAPRSSISSINAPRPSVSSNATRPSITSIASTSSSHSQSYTYFPQSQPRVSAPSSASTVLLRDLRSAIEKSNISECWGDMAGVLLWISLVVGAASKKSENKVLRKYYSALTMRTGVMLCFEHPEAINATMLRMGEVVEGLGSAVQSENSMGDKKFEGSGKRRKV